MKKSDEMNTFHHLIRGIILIGFMLLLFKLLLTNNITLLIAPKMIRFIYFTLFVLFTLGVLLIIRGTSVQKQPYHCDCDGHHSYPTSIGKSLFLYLLFIIPITTGFLFANNILDSSVAINRTIKLGASSQDTKPSKAVKEPNKTNETAKSNDILTNQPEPLSETEYTKLKKDMLQTKNINIKEKTYVPMMTIIQDNLQTMIGKTITIKGFVYREKNFMQNQIIVARFGISCCVADASVYGIMAKGNVAAIPKDKWVQVTGTIEQTQYDGGTIPSIKIKQISKIATPKQPYVFDAGIQIE
ncbi:TIGR03943 family protein [Bacillus sp. sid0103]|uniref:TIGR03943 family putative permease subunit n=1 Tax=Bacillus sp. sid0103 TaxID=2856337 RepID=UPI00210EB35B|nr:TIGR03943 family protein [Bacillus sp. sid0103]